MLVDDVEGMQNGEGVIFRRAVGRVARLIGDDRVSDRQGEIRQLLVPGEGLEAILGDADRKEAVLQQLVDAVLVSRYGNQQLGREVVQRRSQLMQHFSNDNAE